jgi:hypothetical protein
MRYLRCLTFTSLGIKILFQDVLIHKVQLITECDETDLEMISNHMSSQQDTQRNPVGAHVKMRTSNFSKFPSMTKTAKRLSAYEDVSCPYKDESGTIIAVLAPRDLKSAKYLVRWHHSKTDWLDILFDIYSHMLNILTLSEFQTISNANDSPFSLDNLHEIVSVVAILSNVCLMNRFLAASFIQKQWQRVLLHQYLSGVNLMNLFRRVCQSFDVDMITMSERSEEIYEELCRQDCNSVGKDFTLLIQYMKHFFSHYGNHQSLPQSNHIHWNCYFGSFYYQLLSAHYIIVSELLSSNNKSNEGYMNIFEDLLLHMMTFILVLLHSPSSLSYTLMFCLQNSKDIWSAVNTSAFAASTFPELLSKTLCNKDLNLSKSHGEFSTIQMLIMKKLLVKSFQCKQSNELEYLFHHSFIPSTNQFSLSASRRNHNQLIFSMETFHQYLSNSGFIIDEEEINEFFACVIASASMDEDHSSYTDKSVEKISYNDVIQYLFTSSSLHSTLNMNNMTKKNLLQILKKLALQTVTHHDETNEKNLTNYQMSLFKSCLQVIFQSFQICQNSKDDSVSLSAWDSLNIGLDSLLIILNHLRHIPMNINLSNPNDNFVNFLFYTFFIDKTILYVILELSTMLGMKVVSFSHQNRHTYRQSLLSENSIFSSVGTNYLSKLSKSSYKDSILPLQFQFCPDICSISVLSKIIMVSIKSFDILSAISSLLVSAMQSNTFETDLNPNSSPSEFSCSSKECMITFVSVLCDRSGHPTEQFLLQQKNPMRSLILNELEVSYFILIAGTSH